MIGNVVIVVGIHIHIMMIIIILSIIISTVVTGGTNSVNVGMSLEFQ